MISKCLICNKEFKYNPLNSKGKYCSNKCHGLSMCNKTGWWKGRKQKKESNLKRKEKLMGRKLSEETKEKMKKSNNVGRFEKGKPAWNKGKECPQFKGAKNPNWRGGLSFLPYSLDWTESLRRAIRERDYYICRLCGKQQGDKAHAVHHIDYDKQNCNPNNLITLCKSCNSKVNKNREHWKKYFLNNNLNNSLN